jgi:class 3 adenylate cyclase
MDRPDPVRKTVAIVFCDVFAFSRLIAEAGDLVAANVLRAFYDHAGQLAKEHRCLTIKFIGDGFLASFENLGSVFPFITSVEGLLTHDKLLSQQHLAFKFSLHYSDVLYMETSYGTDVLGESVNIAAHLNELARPHQLVISNAALTRLPPDLQARAGSTEIHSLKHGGAVEFHRMDLSASQGRE